MKSNIELLQELNNVAKANTPEEIAAFLKQNPAALLEASMNRIQREDLLHNGPIPPLVALLTWEKCLNRLENPNEQLKLQELHPEKETVMKLLEALEILSMGTPTANKPIRGATYYALGYYTIDKDNPRSVQLLKESAALGHAAAVYITGAICHYGALGTRPSPYQAQALLKHAARHDYPGARELLNENEKMFQDFSGRTPAFNSSAPSQEESSRRNDSFSHSAAATPHSIDALMKQAFTSITGMPATAQAAQPVQQLTFKFKTQSMVTSKFWQQPAPAAAAAPTSEAVQEKPCAAYRQPVSESSKRKNSPEKNVFETGELPNGWVTQEKQKAKLAKIETEKQNGVIRR